MYEFLCFNEPGESSNGASRESTEEPAECCVESFLICGKEIYKLI